MSHFEGLPVLIVGAGPMAVEYCKVLRSMGVTPAVVGRGSASAAKFATETGVQARTGGLAPWGSENKNHLPTYAIVATGEKWVGNVAQELIELGVHNILVEKPGGFDVEDILAVGHKAEITGANVRIAYNRRFYASVEAARALITSDGGVTSFNFEFTEWGHVISGIEKESGVKEQWFLSNSTHIIDLAFHLGGWPVEMSAFSTGGVDWHPLASVFAGAGVSSSGALFSYQANWEAPGRWGLELMTRKHRFIFRPLEKLQVQKIGSVAIEAVAIDDQLDRDFKPGLYKQVVSFLSNEDQSLPTISEQITNLEWYLKIRGGR